MERGAFRLRRTLLVWEFEDGTFDVAAHSVGALEPAEQRDSDEGLDADGVVEFVRRFLEDTEAG